MTGIASLSSTGRDTASARPDRAIVAVSKVLQETRREGQAMVRLIEGANGSSKGQLVDYRA